MPFHYIVFSFMLDDCHGKTIFLLFKELENVEYILE
jgi:hypothetical protein